VQGFIQGSTGHQLWYVIMFWNPRTASCQIVFRVYALQGARFELQSAGQVGQ
jgi:hypothetical protein